MSDSEDSMSSMNSDEDLQSNENADPNGPEDEDHDDMDEDEESDLDDDSDQDEPEAQPEEKLDEEKAAPKNIKFESDPSSVCFHPSDELVAFGTLDGELEVFKYSVEKSEQKFKSKPHLKALRGVKFTPDGKQLFTIGRDKAWKLIDVETQKIVVEIKKAHDCALYSQAFIDEWLLATGDENGGVSVWDHRTPKTEAVQSYKENDDFIADLLIEPDKKKLLLAASAEGTLTAFDIRRKKMLIQSEVFDEEFLSLALIRNKRVVCGGGGGSFEIFNWEEFGYIVNSMKTLSEASIDSMKAFNENILVYGCGDGKVRAAALFPNKPLGIIGNHGDFPVLDLDLDHTKTIVVGVSGDQVVKFWNVEGLEKKIDAKKGRGQDLKMAMNTKTNNFFSGLAEDE